jgi:putative ABC transport system permease protein
VLWDGARLLAAGSALGLLGSMAVTRLLQGLLYGTAAGDPRTLAAVLLVMTAVGLGATAGPAMRAARVDPLEAIRKE